MAYEAVAVRPTDRWLVGLSTDTKPIPTDPRDRLHKLLEADTGNEYLWTGTQWQNQKVNGAINIHDAHPHHTPVNDFLHFHTGLIKTIDWAVTAGSRILTLNNTAGLVVGDELQITKQNLTFREYTLPIITAIDPVDPIITLDRPLDSPWAVGDTIEVVIEDMTVTGSLYTPVSYKIFPAFGETWHIQAFLISMLCVTAPDDAKFGDQPALTNGIILRGYSGKYGMFRTLTNWKTNGDIKLDMIDVVYSDKAGNSFHGVTGNGNILELTGAVPELVAADGDYIEVLIQDDLILHENIRIKVQGHIEAH